jgi:hypothetical protein
MVWALSKVFMMIPDSRWTPGGRYEPPEPLPFEAFRPDALALASPFAIVRSSSPPRGRKVRAA